MRLSRRNGFNWVLQTMKIPDDVPSRNKRVTGASCLRRSPGEAPKKLRVPQEPPQVTTTSERQREVIYAERRQVIEGEDMQVWVTSMIGEVVAPTCRAPPRGYRKGNGTREKCGRHSDV